MADKAGLPFRTGIQDRTDRAAFTAEEERAACEVTCDAFQGMSGRQLDRLAVIIAREVELANLPQQFGEPRVSANRFQDLVIALHVADRSSQPAHAVGRMPSWSAYGKTGRYLVGPLITVHSMWVRGRSGDLPSKQSDEVWSWTMTADGDAALAGLLHGLVADLLKWLDDYPDDQVNPNAAASIQQSIDWVIERLPAERRERLASGDPDPAALMTVTGLLVDLLWWLDTCEDDEVDPDVAVKLQESGAAYVDELTDEQRRRLLEVVDGLAAVEQHDGRRYELRFFPFAIGLVDDEPDAEMPPLRVWVRPEDRAAGPAEGG